MYFRKEALSLIVDNGYKSVAEIGIWKGELSRMIYPVVDRLILVDPLHVDNMTFETYTCRMNEPTKTQPELDAIHNSIVHDMPNAEVFRMTSLEAVEKIEDASLDFVYIDAVHLYAYVYQDVKAWLPKVKPGGMIAGDDYNLTDVGVAVDDLLEGVQTIGPGTSRGRRPRTWFKKLEPT